MDKETAASGSSSPPVDAPHLPCFRPSRDRFGRLGAYGDRTNCLLVDGACVAAPVSVVRRCQEPAEDAHPPTYDTIEDITGNMSESYSSPISCNTTAMHGVMRDVSSRSWRSTRGLHHGGWHRDLLRHQSGEVGRRREVHNVRSICK
jgi:hypothetical protein